MKVINEVMRYLTGALLPFAIMVSCATISELRVNYQLPPGSEELRGLKVFLRFEEARTVKDILSEKARKEFQHFSENISFSMARDQEESFMVGIYDVPSLFKEVFKIRLESLGAEIVMGREKGDNEMVIVLRDLILDLPGKNWHVIVDFEVRLIKNERVLAKQMISGQGERLKLLGHKQAGIVMGEIFTDTVNRVDIKRLFKQAGLQR